MRLTEKPKHYTVEAWSDYNKFLDACEKLEPYQKLSLTSTPYIVWARESGLFLEESQPRVNAWGTETITFIKQGSKE